MTCHKTAMWVATYPDGDKRYICFDCAMKADENGVELKLDELDFGEGHPVCCARDEEPVTLGNEAGDCEGEQEPKPCDFCGSNNTMLDEPITPDRYAVVCNKCGAIGPEHGDGNVAIEKWNTRPYETELEKEIEDLKREINELKKYKLFSIYDSENLPEDGKYVQLVAVSQGFRTGDRWFFDFETGYGGSFHQEANISGVPLFLWVTHWMELQNHTEYTDKKGEHWIFST